MKENLFVQKTLSAARNEIRLQYDECWKGKAVGRSKIGGTPSVPHGFSWPEFQLIEPDGDSEWIPLAFMAQIDLKEVFPYDTEGILPHEGMLSFFYEIETMCWGMFPSDRGCAKVFYFPNADELEPMESPNPDINIPEVPVSFTPYISFPSYEQLEDIGISCQWEEYDRVLDFIGYEYDELGYRSKLIGYPDIIQDSMELYCEIMSRGYSYEEYKKLSNEEKLNIQDASSEWMLLFQMGTVEKDAFTLMFGDCGHIYFWIKKSDLERKDFEHVWLILQCG